MFIEQCLLWNSVYSTILDPMTIIFKIVSIAKVYINIMFIFTFYFVILMLVLVLVLILLLNTFSVHPSSFTEVFFIIFWLREFCSLGDASVRSDVDSILSPWICRNSYLYLSHLKDSLNKFKILDSNFLSLNIW